MIGRGLENSPQPAGVAIRPPSGMTLLEVVLAVTLTVGVVCSATAFYRCALDVRSGLEAEMRVVEARRLIMDRITNELRYALVYKFLGLGVEGSAQQVRFVSATLPGPAAWAVRKPTEAPIRPEHDLRLIGYRLRTYEDEQIGSLIVGGLERNCQKLLAVEVIEEGRTVESTLLTEHIKFIAFRYWQGGRWLESFSGDLPLAVEITMGTEPLPAETAVADYPYATFRRVVYLPGAKKSSPGVIVRGLERGRR